MQSMESDIMSAEYGGRFNFIGIDVSASYYATLQSLVARLLFVDAVQLKGRLLYLCIYLFRCL